ncbi:NADH-FMN oxidoreductase RutF, flavin reductase (DIM6/NTAB) family [Acetitomaculum ruminis DSM 5522]|uniref:NADH-FMN oxidoreductase RutF, flavin reductase (DIM6/NTAB) family n=1 Tax=Acetitomaculum ruminis DSM 5522 TaxID=1120918 RepID=A0A1I0YCG9_9FIRM|nr:flavin reductase family protein [Acetitomaculum ruminis]SFB10961.1 NADH-FMN oxidoreductase RutF, flavin reductase (DIM6/NTAB) family [Acetitomaculum ruminis DSM 5522]
MAKQFWKPGNMLYPLPAVMVSCQRKNERPNIITIAWIGVVCTNPAMVSISVRPQRHSYNIIKETKEFVINLVNAELTRAMDYCGVKSGRDIDKFKATHLTPMESLHVSAPGIKESPVNLECKVTKEIELGSHVLFLAEVKGVTVEGELLDNKGRLNLSKAGLVAYSHGEYCKLGAKVGKYGYSVRKKGKKR